MGVDAVRRNGASNGQGWPYLCPSWRCDFSLRRFRWLCSPTRSSFLPPPANSRYSLSLLFRFRFHFSLSRVSISVRAPKSFSVRDLVCCNLSKKKKKSRPTVGTYCLYWKGGSGDGSWKPRATTSNGPPARSSHSAVFVNSKMIIFGGYDGSKSLNDLQSYDIGEFKVSHLLRLRVKTNNPSYTL